ncbi:MFS transporter [Dactylosporangium matsuzakiense]|uniref:Putative proline/betaine transporter n=1 Tax=Dactylosporangium matsuzakiense TaxID=53360 RepID=A0A9W6KTH1_9ACTN|nr:MFS transporter [Dactylosporangium matsuzakiense]UWZ47728.1 MHS family MFS transporter [Dactylosporangium matsuzakiense]GLL06110.1 MFS transporter [Dactylosporangium matsuzakiense]
MAQQSERHLAPRRVILAGLVGTSLEWYDFFLYGSAAALVFGRLFFPSFESMTGTLLAFATYAVGFVARPLGGIVFGHFGDRVGRRGVLVVTLVLMGGATFAIGLLPTYATWGAAAPILLVALRFLQGLGLGGEWGGAVVMTMEHGGAERRGLNASWPQVGVPAGNLLAAGVLWLLNSVLTDSAFLSWGWRLPFLLSGVLVFVGLWIRFAVAESPRFAEVEGASATARMPLIEVLTKHPRGLLVAMAARVGTDIAFYVFTLYVLTYVTGTVKLPRDYALSAVLIGSAVQLALIPLFGALSDRIGRRPVYAAGAIGAAIWAFAFFPLLDTGNRGAIVLAVVVALIAHAAMYGPQAAFVAEQFSTRLRYSGASMGYQIAGILGGALAPIIAVKLVASTGTATSVSIYVLAALLLTGVGLAFARDDPPAQPERGASPAATRVAA